MSERKKVFLTQEGYDEIKEEFESFIIYKINLSFNFFNRILFNN